MDKKRKNQFYIETWHGGLGIKKIEADMGNLTSQIKKATIHNSKITDLFISNSRHLTDIYINSFWYNGPILESGFPKNDIFYTSSENLEKIKKKVYNFFNVNMNKKIVLYAPTFRLGENVDVYNIDFKLLRKMLKEKYENDY